MTIVLNKVGDRKSLKISEGRIYIYIYIYIYLYIYIYAYIYIETFYMLPNYGE